MISRGIYEGGITCYEGEAVVCMRHELFGLEAEELPGLDLFWASGADCSNLPWSLSYPVPGMYTCNDQSVDEWVSVSRASNYCFLDDNAVYDSDASDA